MVERERTGMRVGGEAAPGLDAARLRGSIEAEPDIAPGRRLRRDASRAFARLRTARREHDNLVVAAEHLLELGEVQAAATILFALEPAILALGVNSPLVALLERVLAALSASARESSAGRDIAGDRVVAAAQARLRALRARLLAPAGELAVAKSELEVAQTEAGAARDPWLTGVIALELGIVHHFARDLSLAAECYERALDSLADADDAVAEARCHGNLGAVAHDQGRMHQAADGYRQAIALLEDAGEPRLIANFRGNLALLEHEHRHYEVARELYQRAALELEEACDARVLGIVLGNWGTLELAAERRRLGPHGAELTHEAAGPRAYALFARAHALLEGCGDRRSLGLAAARLGAVHALEGRLDDAEGHLVRAERQLRRDPVGKIVAACLRGFVDLGRAVRSSERQDGSGARASLERAKARYDAAMTAELAGRAVLDQSDDLRLYSALLAHELDRATKIVGAAG
jgi:tetratricopeptide (TPR) repeat protein